MIVVSLGLHPSYFGRIIILGVSEPLVESLDALLLRQLRIVSCVLFLELGYCANQVSFCCASELFSEKDGEFPKYVDVPDLSWCAQSFSPYVLEEFLDLLTILLEYSFVTIEDREGCSEPSIIVVNI